MVVQSLAQYQPYRPNNYLQPRPYNPYPVRQPQVAPAYDRYPVQRSGPVIIHQNNQPKVCHQYAGVTRCP